MGVAMALGVFFVLFLSASRLSFLGMPGAFWPQVFGLETSPGIRVGFVGHLGSASRTSTKRQVVSGGRHHMGSTGMAGSQNRRLRRAERCGLGGSCLEAFSCDLENVSPFGRRALFVSSLDRRFRAGARLFGDWDLVFRFRSIAFSHSRQGACVLLGPFFNNANGAWQETPGASFCGCRDHGFRTVDSILSFCVGELAGRPPASRFVAQLAGSDGGGSGYLWPANVVGRKSPGDPGQRSSAPAFPRKTVSNRSRHRRTGRGVASLVFPLLVASGFDGLRLPRKPRAHRTAVPTSFPRGSWRKRNRTRCSWPAQATLLGFRL